MLGRLVTGGVAGRAGTSRMGGPGTGATAGSLRRASTSSEIGPRDFWTNHVPGEPEKLEKNGYTNTLTLTLPLTLPYPNPNPYPYPGT